MKRPYEKSIEEQMLTHYKSLGERNRRQYAALEVNKLGRGGQCYISQLFDICRPVIIRGQRELANPELLAAIADGKQRKAGGGRKKKK